MELNGVLIESLKIWDRAGKTELSAPPGQSSVLVSVRQRGAGERVKRFRIDPVLLLQNPRRERGGVVSRENWHARLGQNGSGVELGRDQMDGAAVFSEPQGQRPPVGVESAQIR